MKQAGNYKADEITAPGNQAPSGDVRLIIKLLYPLENPLAGFFRDVGVISQYLGNGYDGETEIYRYVL